MAAAAAGMLAFAYHSWAAFSLPAEQFARFGVTWTCAILMSHITGAALEQWASLEATLGHLTDRRLGFAVTGIMIGVPATVVGIMVGDVQWMLVGGSTGGFLGLLHWRKGVFVGSGGHRTAGMMLLVESAARVLLAGLLGFAWAVPVGTAVGTTVGRPRPGLMAARRRVGGGRFIVGASTAAAAFQLILGGAPLVVWAVGGSAQDVTSVFLVFLFSKAPLTLLFAVQGLVVSALIRQDQQVNGLLRFLTGWRTAAAIVAVAATGGAVMLPAVVNVVTAATIGFVPAGLIAGGVAGCAIVQLLGQKPAADGTPLIVGRAWLWALTVGILAGLTVGQLGIVWAVSIGFAAGCVTAAGRTLATWAKVDKSQTPPVVPTG